MKKLNIGIIGAGAWGFNHIRTFNQIEHCRVIKVCDLEEKNFNKVKSLNSGIKFTRDYLELINAENIDAMVIATPADTHYEIARAALLAGKHILVEKPLCFKQIEAEHLLTLARERNLVLLVGHLLLYHPAIQWIKEFIKGSELGEIHYIYSQRLNLGKIRTNENVVWSLVPHDLSVMLHLLEQPIVKQQGTGKSFINPPITDVFFYTFEFANGTLGHGQVSWLEPHKTRCITIVGSKKKIVFDDTSSTEKIKVYNKGNFSREYQNFGESLLLQDGDVFSPALPNTEPLKLEALHFLECIREGKQPLTDGQNGLEIVKILEKLAPA